MKKIIYSLLILATVMISCSKDDSEEATNYTIWSGPKIEFIKQIDADPNEAINQDKITSSVSITRGNSGGEIYNVVLENEAAKKSVQGERNGQLERSPTSLTLHFPLLEVP